MSKKLTITGLILGTIFVLAGLFAGVWYQYDQAAKSGQDLDKRISELEGKIAEVKATEDANGYTPVNLVTFFMEEVIAGSSDKAKLYLTEGLKTDDLTTLLGLEQTDLPNLITDQVEEELEGGRATVSYSGYLKNSDETFQKTFLVEKEDNLWKIIEIE